MITLINRLDSVHKQKIEFHYDLNNKVAQQIIDDYNFFNYYTESLISDWSKFYNEDSDDSKDWDEIQDDMEMKTKVIIKHLNTSEWERYKNINYFWHTFIYYKTQCKTAFKPNVTSNINIIGNIMCKTVKHSSQINENTFLNFLSHNELFKKIYKDIERI